MSSEYGLALKSLDGDRFKEGILPGGEFHGVDLPKLVKRSPYSKYKNRRGMLKSLQGARDRILASINTGNKVKRRLSSMSERPDTKPMPLFRGVDTNDGQSEDEEENPSPFHNDLATRHTVFYNPKSRCRDLVLLVMVP
ncbi:hypothetical protein SARC_06832 [Sphaeroforma arctica JP610]|uniref:Uncharacterized protein n=1 Tax=Sphaeroforma arctica JP610 TaxID=667725 RepID=A0A0L0FVZ3_9EUKA|nr:hypothetical protein SARC_06832 [Sphaeroforma arctica JP610]KNC80819.1 hypothetical protein SARC_06832 [Sphaeroforma arctica JP610]|eukprot:XP_014154721.1 hypothetical protein SARC_06832 [Sphaeroforma arctica JP610]